MKNRKIDLDDTEMVLIFTAVGQSIDVIQEFEDSEEFDTEDMGGQELTMRLNHSLRKLYDKLYAHLSPDFPDLKEQYELDTAKPKPKGGI